jgi:O-antigen/teichoic acid export membrane protein
MTRNCRIRTLPRISLDRFMALDLKLKSLRHLLKSRLACNAGWMLVGQGFKALIQVLYFTIIARSLGPQNYGAFVGVVGLVSIVSPFASMGSGYLLIKNVARDQGQFRKNWGSALLTILSSASILFGVVTLVSRFLLPASIPIRLVMMVAAADLFGTSISDNCGHAFVAFERMKWTAWISVLLSALRLAAAIILRAIHAHPTASQWGELYLVSTSIAMLLALLLVIVKLGTPTFGFSRSVAEIREGFYFSVMQSAQTIYNDIDKAMLARLGTLEATGIYGAAYRIVDVSFTPVAAVLTAAFPKFFRVGAGGMSATLRYVKPLIFRATGYAALVALGLWISAQIVPLILGQEYRLTVEALRWLAVLPLLKTVHSFLADALTGAGYQALRTAVSAGVAVFNVLLNIWIIPAYSWRGASWSSIASDALLICAIGTAVFVLSRRSQSLSGSAKALAVRAEA